MHHQLIFVALFLLACGDKDADDTASRDGSGDDFVPTEGDWTLDDPSVHVDTCNVEEHLGPYGEGSTSTLQMTAATTFDLTDQGGEVDACTLTGLSFACDTQSTADDTPSDSGFDAVMLVESTTSGSFSDADTVTIQTVVQMDCEGTDCAAIEMMLGGPFPCDLTLSQDAAAAP